MTTNLKQLATVLIEIPKNSNIKYEIKDGKLFCDRVLHTPMSYIFNYGCFEETLAGDGDPLDAVLLTDTSFFPGTYVPSKIIGVLLTSDDKGEDEKVICVPANNIDPTHENTNNLKDLPPSTLQQIRFFFQNYKSLEKGKTVTVGEFQDAQQAVELYHQSQQNYHNKLLSEKAERDRRSTWAVPATAQVQTITGNGNKIGVFAPKITK